MALTPEIGAFLYSVVRESWILATVVTKYLLIANIGVLAYRRELNREKFTESLIEWSKPVLIIIVVIGGIFSATKFSLTPLFPLISQIIAVTTLGYLFWKY